jgi:hypothetical protein
VQIDTTRTSRINHAVLNFRAIAIGDIDSHGADMVDLNGIGDDGTQQLVLTSACL